MTRLLICDDSEIAIETIKEMVYIDPEIEVVGCASDGQQAVEMAKGLQPDIITMDLEMPLMGGLEAIKRILAERNVPIVVISERYTEKNVFNAIDLGAMDVMPKPELDLASQKKFCEKLKSLALVNLYKPQRSIIPALEKKKSKKVIGIVASTGGPKALKTILSNLKDNMNACVIIIQHMENGFTEGMVDWMNSFVTNYRIEIARHPELIEPGRIFVAPEDVHIIAGVDGRIHLIDKPPVDGHKPSGTMLLESIARQYRSDAIAVVLTGMGSDGATGSAEVRKNGGLVICQDKETSMVWGMPKEATRLGQCTVLPIHEIPNRINELA